MTALCAVGQECPKWCNISLFSKPFGDIRGLRRDGPGVYDEKEGFNFFCVLFVYSSCFPLLSPLTFSCVCFTSLFIVSYGAFVMCEFAFLSLFLIRMSALESLYAKCPIGFPIEWRG